MANLIENEQLTNRIVESIRGVISFSGQIDIRTDLASYGMDSMKTMEAVIALENEFDIQFNDNELLLIHFSTVERMKEQVELKLQKEA